MAYEIVSKLILRDGTIYIESADSAVRPLEFRRRVDGELTARCRAAGLAAALELEGRRIHRGAHHLRAKSRLTRALRSAMSAIGLEQFQAMAEAEGAARLAALAAAALAEEARRADTRLNGSL